MATGGIDYHFDFAGARVIITGAARGIGESLALAFGEARASLLIVDVLEEIIDVKGRVQKLGAACESMIVDVADRSQTRNMAARAVERFGGIDILINNASITSPSAFLGMTGENWAKLIDTNLTSVFNTCQDVVPCMVEQRTGKIINFSSVNAKIGGKNTSHYCAAKGGVESFSRCLARELAPYNIRVNVVAPGYIDTAMLAHMPKAQKDKLTKRIPLGRLGTPSDLNGCVLFLASEASSYITGQVININGGFYM